MFAKLRKQIPRRLKSARDDKNKPLALAHPFDRLRAWLKLRPFKTARNNEPATRYNFARVFLLDNKAIAGIFYETADLMEVNGDD